MYKIGTLEEFNLDDLKAKKNQGWTENEIIKGKKTIEEGGETYINNVLEKCQNPNGLDEYIWEHSEGDIQDSFSTLARWKKKICNPVPPKYYIAISDGDYIYGKVASDVCVKFGLNVADIEIFDTKEDYLARARELGVEIGDLES